ncbi:MAG: O-antigen ligase family protein [Bacteroidia bacterium]
MFELNPKLKEQIATVIYAIMIVSIYFSSYPSSSLSTDSSVKLEGENIGWLHAPALLSLSMIVLVLFAFLFTKPKEIFKTFWNDKALFVFSFICIYLLAGFINSDHHSYILQRIQIKLPFLFLALCAAVIKFSRKNYHRLLFIFLLSCTLVALYVFIHYLIYFIQINHAYLNAKVMPTPMNHIRFSILAALAVYTSYYLVKNKAELFRYDKTVIVSLGIFLLFFVHVYSVRSGILALYGITFTELVLLGIRKSYRQAAIILVFIFGAGMSTYFLSPTIKNKIVNTRQDIGIYQNNGVANYSSIATRFISYQNSIILWKENILLGCGLGDLEIKNNALFKSRNPEITTPIIPHNEFLYYLASMGIMGVASFVFCFFFPLFYRKNFKNDFLLMAYVMVLLSCLTEPMIETQLGVACTVIFIILPLMARKDESVQRAIHLQTK